MLRSVPYILIYSGSNVLASLVYFTLISRLLNTELLASLLFVEIFLRLTPYFVMLGFDQLALKDTINGKNNYLYVLLVSVVTNTLACFVLSMYFDEVGILLFIAVLAEVLVKLSIDRSRALNDKRQFRNFFFFRRQALVIGLILLCLLGWLSVTAYLTLLITTGFLFVLFSKSHEKSLSLWKGKTTIEFKDFLRRGIKLIPHVFFFYLLTNSDKFYIKNFAKPDEVVEYMTYFKLAGVVMLFIQAFNIVWLPYSLRNSKSLELSKLVRVVIYFLAIAIISLFALSHLLIEPIRQILTIGQLDPFILFIVLVAVTTEPMGETFVYRLHEKEKYGQISISSFIGLLVLLLCLSLMPSVLGLSIAFLLGMAAYNISRAAYSLRA